MNYNIIYVYIIFLTKIILIFNFLNFRTSSFRKYLYEDLNKIAKVLFL